MNQAFLQRRIAVFVLATFCCFLWGSAYPAIKNGYALFAIAPADTASKLVFAGWRFLFAGFVLLGVAAATGRALWFARGRDWRDVATLGLIQTAIQYVFFYIGLAHTTGVKSSIMNGTASFFGALLAHLCYRDDRLTLPRVLGCLIGFAGVLVVNLRGQSLDLSFTFLGEGCVIIAAFVLSVGMVYGKNISQRMDVVVMTAWQLTLGGAMLLLGGYGAGGTLQGFTWLSTGLLAYMVLLSSAAFVIWGALLKYHPVGMVTVFNFLVPVFGVLLSAWFLDERMLEWQNGVALLLVCVGIWLVTRQRSVAPGA